MARKRMIHSTLWTSDQFCKLEEAEQKLYIYFINEGDDEGRFKTSPRRACMMVFPERDQQKRPAYAIGLDITPKMVQQMIEHIARVGLIVLYQVNNECYGYHPNWDAYQTIRKDRFSKSDLPSPDGAKIWLPKDDIVVGMDISDNDSDDSVNGIDWDNMEEDMENMEEMFSDRLSTNAQPADNHVTTKPQPADNHFATQPNQTKPNQTKPKKSKDLVENDQPKESREEQEFGNPEINEMLSTMLDKIGIDDFTSSNKWKRIYGKHCLNLLGKLGPNEFVRRLESLVNDNFKRKRCNDIKFVYEEIKAFIDPKTPSSNKVGYA